ncbi:hypothetical protein K501DRAFT_320903 [Backusella circina FSU 941]|nr:hypothetical protein K501DRAFT_320903 [Backusella circina FSU 941]
MSTIVSDFKNPAVGHESQPNQPMSALFTCLACQVAFPTSERQRAHYRTDWHKYNLKRKVAGLTSVNAEQFAQKVLLQQAQGKEEQEKMGLIYECAICNKSYLSENAFNNHIKSKKHLEMEHKADLLEEQDRKEDNKTENNNNQFLSDDDEDEHIHEADDSNHASTNPLITCLFCQHPSDDFHDNLEHMKKAHGFFLPDIEYLTDSEGLITYLSEKINVDHLCLYCNGRGKQWQTATAARAHMVDRGHCKMAYDESEDPEQLLKFYDFGTQEDGMDIDVADKGGDNELVLESGVKLGNRKFAKFYKQYKPKKETPSEAEEIQNQQVQQQPETLRRKERRHLLITDGQVEDIKKTADGIRESNIKQSFFRQVSIKHNTNTTLRARTQNPI